MESAIVPGIYDPTLADEDLRDRAPSARTGWCGGWRARKGCWPASRPARRSRRRSTSRAASSAGVIVTVFPDGAEKYLNETFWTADD